MNNILFISIDFPRVEGTLKSVGFKVDFELPDAKISYKMDE